MTFEFRVGTTMRRVDVGTSRRRQRCRPRNKLCLSTTCLAVLHSSNPCPSIFAPTLTTLRSEFLRLISSFQGFSTPRRKSSRIAIRFDKLFLVSFTGEDIVSFQVRELFRVYCTSSPHFNGELWWKIEIEICVLSNPDFFLSSRIRGFRWIPMDDSVSWNLNCESLDFSRGLSKIRFCIALFVRRES